jgi:hypothetical protein
MSSGVNGQKGYHGGDPFRGCRFARPMPCLLRQGRHPPCLGAFPADWAAFYSHRRRYPRRDEESKFAHKLDFLREMETCLWAWQPENDPVFWSAI